MSNIVEMLPSKELIGRASENYYRNLRLPTNSRVLIITDKQDLADRVIDQNAANKIVRRQMADNFKTLMDTHKLTHATVEFDDRTPEEELYGETTRALGELGAGLKENEQATIIYIGNNWEKRSNIYRAAEDFGKNHKVKLAVSLGFSTGDCKVMAELDEEKMDRLRKAERYVDNFFRRHKSGTFDIASRNDFDNQEYHLTLKYNTSKAPFYSELGEFDGIHEPELGANYSHVKVVNIPGGEKFGPAFPFKKVNGQFSAGGIVFTIEKGLIVKYEKKGESTRPLDLSQLALLKRIDEKKYLAIAELGIGFFSLIGLLTYPDSSILSYEKSGFHLGFGHTDESPEAAEIDNIANEFHHTDFVLDHAAALWHKFLHKSEELKVSSQLF